MDNLKSLLEKKHFGVSASKRPINERWEKAIEFGKYVDLPVLVVLRLFKLYGQKETLLIRSWLVDAPCDHQRGGKVALAHWKLKENRGRVLPILNPE